MEKIASFQINHDVLSQGIYLSRIDCGDIYTYDLRFKIPNSEFIDIAAAHTIEHLFATYIRSSDIAEHVIYFGPMGCLTGFYFITKGLPHSKAISAILKTMEFIKDFEGEIPGNTRIECGNYLMHDLEKAKAEAAGFFEKTKGWTEARLVYPK